MMLEVDSLRLHRELKRSNPHMSYKNRRKVIDTVNILLFIQWIGTKEGLESVRALGVQAGVI